MAKIHANTCKLIALMTEHDLSAPQVAGILKCEPNTVRVWRTVRNNRVIPDMKLEYLQMKLAAMTKRERRLLAA